MICVDEGHKLVLEQLPLATSEQGEEVEAALYASVSHLRSHRGVTLACLADLLDALPDDEPVTGR